MITRWKAFFFLGGLIDNEGRGALRNKNKRNRLTSEALGKEEKGEMLLRDNIKCHRG